MPTDPAHTAALGVTNDVFGRLVELGRASVNVGLSNTPYPQPTIEVRPSNPAACAVTILAEEKQIDLIFGPHETLREIYFPEENERLKELQSCLEGVANGRYEEQVEVTRDGATVTGRFLDGPPAYVRYGSLAFGPARVTEFEPY
jgi:hypothetical protein